MKEGIPQSTIFHYQMTCDIWTCSVHCPDIDCLVYNLTIMEATPTQFMLIDWAALPQFLREGIQSFPFESTEEAQIFSDLLVSRIRCLLIRGPSLNDSAETIREFISSLRTELVRNGFTLLTLAIL